jgi:hypothetical protein
MIGSPFPSPLGSDILKRHLFRFGRDVAGRVPMRMVAEH